MEKQMKSLNMLKRLLTMGYLSLGVFMINPHAAELDTIEREMMAMHEQPIHESSERTDFRVSNDQEIYPGMKHKFNRGNIIKTECLDKCELTNLEAEGEMLSLYRSSHLVTTSGIHTITRDLLKNRDDIEVMKVYIHAYKPVDEGSLPFWNREGDPEEGLVKILINRNYSLESYTRLQYINALLKFYAPRLKSQKIPFGLAIDNHSITASLDLDDLVAGNDLPAGTFPWRLYLG